MIYGDRKVGKTTCACSFPKAILLGFEKGWDYLDGVLPVPINSWKEALDVKKQLLKDVKAVADDLDAHKKAQVTKEKAVDDKLAVIQGEANVEGSIKKALADAKAYADAEDKKIEDLLGTKKDAAAVDTAFGRIAKEVARATAAEEALDSRLDTAEGKITALETTVGNAQSGLVKDVADLKSLDAGTRLTAAETSIDTLEAWVAAHGTITNAELDAMLNDVYGTQA